MNKEWSHGYISVTLLNPFWDFEEIVGPLEGFTWHKQIPSLTKERDMC